MSQLVRQREDVRHALIPRQQDKRIFSVGAGAETACGFSLVLGKVDPSVAVRLPHHLHILPAEDRQTLFDVFPGLLDRHLRIIFRVDGDLQVRESHAVELVYLFEQSGVSAHMRCQLFRDQVDLAVVHLLRDLLPEQQAVKHGVKAPECRECLLSLHLRVVGGCRHILIRAYLCGERGKSGAAHLLVLLILIIVLEKGIAQGVLPAVCGKRVKFHVRQLCHIVDLIRRLDRLGQRRDGALRLRVEQMRFHAQQILQIMPVFRGDLSRLPDHIVLLPRDLVVDKAEPAEHLRSQMGKRLVALLVVRVVIVDRHRQITVAADQHDQVVKRSQIIQARLDRLRCVQLSPVIPHDAVTERFCPLHIAVHLLLCRVDQRQIPCQFHRNVPA